MEQPAAEATDLIKSFEGAEALKNINFQIANNIIYGFIGPDGAGKTTLFRILASLMEPDSGEVRVLGRDVVDDYAGLRPLLGYMPGRFGLYEDLSVAENLTFFASVFGTSVEEGYKLIEPVYSQIEPFRDRLAGDLSGGMKQKLALSCALVHRPQLLILDEPTTGVDAVSRKEFWEMLAEIKEAGITVIVSTPYMDEARRCDRVSLMQEGRILRTASPRQLLSSFEKPLLAVRGDRKYEMLGYLRSLPGMESVHPFGDSIHVIPERGEWDGEKLSDLLRREGFGDAGAESAEPTVEDLFMDLMTAERGN